MLKFSQYRDGRHRAAGSERLSEAQCRIGAINGSEVRGATVSLPGGIDLDERAARMNDFWRALVDLQFEDVVVVAVSVHHDRDDQP